MSRFFLWGGFTLLVLGFGSCTIAMVAAVAGPEFRNQAEVTSEDLSTLGSGAGYLFVFGFLSVIAGSLLKTFDFEGKVRSASQKRCPSCAEKIHRKAAKCRFCGEDLSEALPISQKQVIRSPSEPADHPREDLDSEWWNSKKQRWEKG